MGLVKRNLYKKERKPARKKGVLEYHAPISLLDASRFEITAALAILAHEVNVLAGRGCGYDSLKDEYTIIGKSGMTGKAQDFKVRGVEVADLIKVFRALNGGCAGKFNPAKIS